MATCHDLSRQYLMNTKYQFISLQETTFRPNSLESHRKVRSISSEILIWSKIVGNVRLLTNDFFLGSDVPFVRRIKIYCSSITLENNDI